MWLSVNFEPCQRFLSRRYLEVGSRLSLALPLGKDLQHAQWLGGEHAACNAWPMVNQSILVGLVVAIFTGVGCVPARNTVPAAATPLAAAPLSAAATSSSPAPGMPRERPELNEHFNAEQVSGTIALFDSADSVLTCSDVSLCKRPTIPASTFKIANSMIALETGVVEDAETVLPWDGNPYPVEEWNHNNTLRSALRVSCVPCFQGIARKVGESRMKDWVTKLDYGNHDVTGGLDHFWLSGGLRISPLQQIDFLRRFDAGKLPISARTAETVQDIMTLDVGQSHVLRGKTGLQQPPDFPELAAWFVGWLELGNRRVYFATLINACKKGIDIKPVRRRVTERVLRALQLLPADATRAPNE
jgi:beta-lactamase class D